MLLENPYLKGDDSYYLMITCEPTNFGVEKDNSSLLFLGGFDIPDISLNHACDTEYLSLIYPAGEPYLSLLEKIGTVDFTPPFL
ncbi:hypothetical protein [Legionella cherrii]|uniref:Uncharacterized protein n=2 Tax=Legionella cherrii TaxID=28084 RepID=A0ABY6T5C7_9GAMM|nr:hypothetical protein [Legionella cherrii]VEB35521.1 Uncharacterised protein [Legionella cherrii]